MFGFAGVTHRIDLLLSLGPSAWAVAVFMGWVCLRLNKCRVDSSWSFLHFDLRRFVAVDSGLEAFA